MAIEFGTSPAASRKILITGANGQLGLALRARFGDDPRVEYTTRQTLDLTHPGLPLARRWRDYGTVINAAAYTAVDAAETPAGRTEAWAANVTAVAALAAIAREHDITLVHISSDYVYDGTRADGYTETEPVNPLGVYGQTKAAGDAIVTTVPRHYILRTSWVIGHGRNFVRTMASLAERGVDPSVVDDQTGRLTFTPTLARAIEHLLTTEAPAGVYNVTNAGTPTTWHRVAQEVYRLTGHDPGRVSPVTTDQYHAAASTPISPRPAHSVLQLAKLASIGYSPTAWEDELRTYLSAS